MQLALDGRQRDVYDRHVEHDHQLRERDHDEGEIQVARRRFQLDCAFRVHHVLFLCLVDVVWQDSQAHVLVDPDQAELRQLVARERRLGGRVVNDLRLDAPVLAQVCDPPLAGGLHVLIPSGVVAERPRDDEAVAQWPHPDRRGVLATRAPAAVAQDADDRHPATSCNEQDDRVDEPCGEPDDAARARSQVDGVDCCAHLFASMAGWSHACSYVMWRGRCLCPPR